jgi:hypothetical protein
MDNEPLNFEEQLQVLAGVVLALGYVLSVDQREDAVRILRTHADQSGTPTRCGIILRRIAEQLKNPVEPTQH